MAGKMSHDDLKLKAPFGIHTEQTAREYAETEGFQEIVDLLPQN